MPLLSAQSPGTQAERTLVTERGAEVAEALCLLHGPRSPRLGHEIEGVLSPLLPHPSAANQIKEP